MFISQEIAIEILKSCSNLGSVYLNDMGEGALKPETRRLVMGAIQAHFPPGKRFFQGYL